MITPQDAEFHPPTSDAPTWAETNFFGFYIPQVPLNVGVYALFRPNVGVVISTVAINSRFVTRPWEADYWDPQHQLPIAPGTSLLDYSLRNGLRVRSSEPNRVWDVEFDNGDGVSMEFRYTALMDGFDISDPEQDPIVAAQQGSDTFAWGEAYKGHFDQTGHYSGVLRLRGHEFPIDCVSTMDHSWGLREEHQGHNMSWLHAHFGDDFAFHGIFDFDHTGGPDAVTSAPALHGYVLKDGVVHGIKSGTSRTVREGFYAKSVEIDVVDADDREWHFIGLARTSFPWQAGPGTVGFNVLAEWRSEGRSGWGEIQDFVGPQHLTRLFSEF